MDNEQHKAFRNVYQQTLIIFCCNALILVMNLVVLAVLLSD